MLWLRMVILLLWCPYWHSWRGCCEKKNCWGKGLLGFHSLWGDLNSRLKTPDSLVWLFLLGEWKEWSRYCGTLPPLVILGMSPISDQTLLTWCMDFNILLVCCHPFLTFLSHFSVVCTLHPGFHIPFMEKYDYCFFPVLDVHLSIFVLGYSLIIGLSKGLWATFCHRHPLKNVK